MIYNQLYDHLQPFHNGLQWITINLTTFKPFTINYIPMIYNNLHSITINYKAVYNDVQPIMWQFSQWITRYPFTTAITIKYNYFNNYSQ